MINVLHYAPGFIFGGIESCILNWYRNIDREKIQFILVKLNDIDDTEFIKEFLELGGRIYSLPPFNLKSIWNFQIKIQEIINMENINIVHVHDFNSGYFLLSTAKKMGIKCRILHAHTTDFSSGEKNLIIKKILKKNCPKNANTFLSCSYEAGEWVCGKKYRNQIKVIKNGIEVENFTYNLFMRQKIRKELGIENKIVIGNIGRLTYSKNIPFLFDIISKLVKENENFVLLFVGDGSVSIFDEYCRKNDISSNVIFVPAKKNVWDYYSCIDIFCAPSLYEGFGMTAIEAQASGIPTLVSKAFPKTVEVTHFIKRLDINDTAEWINWIHKYINNRYEEEGIKAVITAGYTADGVASQIQAIYEINS